MVDFSSAFNSSASGVTLEPLCKAPYNAVLIDLGDFPSCLIWARASVRTRSSVALAPAGWARCIVGGTSGSSAMSPSRSFQVRLRRIATAPPASNAKRGR